MITAKEALKQSMKGDPERALIIAEYSIKEAVKLKQQTTTLKISKHLYGWAEIRFVVEALRNKGYSCIFDLLDVQSNSYIIKVRW